MKKLKNNMPSPLVKAVTAISFLGISLFGLFLPHLECSAEEYYIIGNAESSAKPETESKDSFYGFDLRTPQGVVLKYGDTLPKGYRWLSKDKIQLPGGVILDRSGSLVLPNNEYPEEYDIKADGDIAGPHGIILHQSEKETSKEKKAEQKAEDKKESKEAKGANPAAAEKELSIEELLDFDRIFAEEKAREDKSKKEQPVSTAEKEKEKAEPAPPVQKKGEPIQIPAGAIEKKNLAFLQGCWRDDTHSMGWCGGIGSSGSGYNRFCFDKNGRGQHTVYTNNGTFKGTASASIQNGKLFIRNGRAYREKGKNRFGAKEFVPNTIDCTGSGRETICKIIEDCPSCPKVKTGVRLRRD